MIDRIKELEKLSMALEPSASDRQLARNKIIDYTEKFLGTINNDKVYVDDRKKGADLLLSPVGEEGMSIDDVIELGAKNIDNTGLNPASGGHLGYIPGGGIYYSSLADYWAAITNRYAGVFYASPGAVRMENMLIQWMASLMGYPVGCGGNLTSGGSIANLVAMVTARDASGLKAKDYSRAVIYLSEQVHHSADKAIRIAGMAESIKRYIPLDESYRIIPDELEKLILKDKQEGLIPWMIIASAGTTDVGAVDPLDEIADIAQKHTLWYHIDAAYGGFFMLTADGKKIMKGIERSDSLIIDPHKGLFLPYGLGAVLVKDINAQKRSHFYLPNYLQDTLMANDELSPADLSPELTKHFRGLRMWLPIKIMGLKPFRACLEEKLLLARYFYEEIRKIGFETGPYPQLSVVTYRYVPKKGNANEFNKRLLHEIVKDGRVFISSTMLDGKFTLRLAVLAFRTHLQTIDLTLKLLKDKVEELNWKWEKSDL